MVPTIWPWLDVAESGGGWPADAGGESGWAERFAVSSRNAASRVPFRMPV